MDKKKFNQLSYEFETAFDEDALLNIGNVEFTELVTGAYERQTEASCVYWHDEGSRGNNTTLPRPDEYETEGYTEWFWNWLKNLEEEAFNAGAETTKDVCLYIIGKLDKPIIPDYIWVGAEENDEGEIPCHFFINEDDARAWLRDRFNQHLKATMIPREHFIWTNQDYLHQVFDGDTRWGLSVRKVTPAFIPFE